MNGDFHDFGRRTLLALAGGLALAACGKAGDGASTSGRAAESGSEALPAAGGELVFAFDGAAVSQFPLDPHKSGYAPHHRIMRSIFDNLIVALPGNRFGSWLATAWEISPDARTYTFHLRQDVTFHDGTRFDAQAVKTNLDRIKNPKNALFTAADLGPMESVTVLGPYTLRVQFGTVFSPFLMALSKSNFGMVSPAVLAKDDAYIQAHPVGTGPFRFKSMQVGTEVVLERNADYRWAPPGAGHEGPARIERLVFRNVPEESTRVAVLQNGQAGACDLIPPQNLLALRKSPDYQVIERELLNFNYSLGLNVAKAPWNDPRMREAFRLSLDLDTAVKTIYLGTLTRAWSPLSPSIEGYDKSLEGSWKPDPASARRILDELGWKAGADGIRVKDGKRLTLVFLESQGNREKRLDLLTVLRRQLRDSGFEVRIDTQPTAAALEKAANGEFDMAAGSSFASDPDMLRRIYTPTERARTSTTKVDDAELTALLQSAYQQTDPEERAKRYHRAQHLIVERTYSIPTYVLIYNVVANRSVRGIAIDVHGFPVFHDASIQPDAQRQVGRLS